MALAGKPAGIFTSTAVQGGGQEVTILTSVTQVSRTCGGVLKARCNQLAAVAALVTSTASVNVRRVSLRAKVFAGRGADRHVGQGDSVLTGVCP